MNNLTYKGQRFSVGDTIEVHNLVKEGEKERTQIFEGVLISIKGIAENQSFTVRKIATGAIGVERIWPLHTPRITAIKLKKSGSTRRAKLYYLRGRIGKDAIKIKEKVVVAKKPAKSVTKAPAKTTKVKSKITKAGVKPTQRKTRGKSR